MPIDFPMDDWYKMVRRPIKGPKGAHFVVRPHPKRVPPKSAPRRKRRPPRR